MKKVNLDALMTISAYAKESGYTDTHVRYLINSGAIDTVSIGGKTFINATNGIIKKDQGHDGN